MPAIRPIQQPQQAADSTKARLKATVCEALFADLPPVHEKFEATDREDWFTRVRCGVDLIYGPVERAAMTIHTLPAGMPLPATLGPKLYVIKENGEARCDGQPMAFKDIPLTGCAFIDKRGPIEDAVFAWESIMFSDGAVKAGTAMPAGVTLVPKVPGAKVRSVSGGDGDDYQGAMT